MVVVVFDEEDGRVAAVFDGNEAGAADVRFEGHHGFERGGDDHLEAEVGKDVHGERGVFVVGLVEGFVDDHRRVHRRAVVVAAQLVAQGGGKAGGGEFLALAAGALAAAAVAVDFFAGGVELATVEFDVLAHVEYGVAPAFVFGVFGGEAFDEAVQGLVALFGVVAVVAPGVFQCLVEVVAEGFDFGQRAVAGVDVQVARLAVAVVERHLAQAGIDEFHAFVDGVACVGEVGGEGGEVLVALFLQEVEEVLFVRGQAVGFEAT